MLRYRLEGLGGRTPDDQRRGAACPETTRDRRTHPRHLEETFVAGERATIRWRYFIADGNSVRGVNLMRAENGLIVETMGYVKG